MPPHQSFAIIICYRDTKEGINWKKSSQVYIVRAELWNGLLPGHADFAELSPLEFDGAAFWVYGWGVVGVYLLEFMALLLAVGAAEAVEYLYVFVL